MSTLLYPADQRVPWNKVEPYRHATELEELTAAAREGTLRLEVAPRHVALSVASHKATFAEGFLALETVDRKNRVKRRSMKLGEGSLFVVRGFPRDDLSLWIESSPGRVQRVFGVRPRDLLDATAMAALRDLNRLAARLSRGLSERVETVGGLELGNGADRVLIADHGDRFEVFVRRLFRGTAGRVLTVHEDGTIVVPARAGGQKVVCQSRFGITVIGDYIRFSDPTGTDLVRLAIPWITPQDRKELARRFGQMVDSPAPHAVEDGEFSDQLGGLGTG